MSKSSVILIHPLHTYKQTNKCCRVITKSNPICPTEFLPAIIIPQLMQWVLGSWQASSNISLPIKPSSFPPSYSTGGKYICLLLLPSLSSSPHHQQGVSHYPRDTLIYTHLRHSVGTDRETARCCRGPPSSRWCWGRTGPFLTRPLGPARLCWWPRASPPRPCHRGRRAAVGTERWSLHGVRPRGPSY